MWRASLTKSSRTPSRPAAVAAGIMVLALLHPLVCRSAETWREALPEAQALGSGEMTWFGLRIYRATLWSAQRPFDATRTFALQLHYHVGIGKERLVSTSIDEMARIGKGLIAADVLERWRTELNDAFVDVAAGDELIGVYLPMQGMELHNQRRLLAKINDIELANAFFGIWLDKATRDEALRKRLRGESP
ncbi:hypothetical protein CEJ42_16380 [Herbaspirillum robiniae]|uniref:Chalcone isomerase domain-containing protein n=2 Tax=Herbaspirillum robiniae TaxID=2014887 RepID=A0A246WPB9_9BURK|nr:hypothetical protein CEJ42_16380 [Herbaspirillum robiniae]